MIPLLRVAAALSAVEGWPKAEFTGELLRQLEANFWRFRVLEYALIVYPQNSKVIMRFAALDVLNQKRRAVLIAKFFEQFWDLALDHFWGEDVALVGSDRDMLNRVLNASPGLCDVVGENT